MYRKGMYGIIINNSSLVMNIISSTIPFQATGGQDKVIHIWDGSTNLHVHTFRGHNQPVSVSDDLFARGLLLWYHSAGLGLPEGNPPTV